MQARTAALVPSLGVTAPRMRIAHFLKSLGCCLLFSMAGASGARAVLIYNLVDQGVLAHSLTGTITVQDTAPDDGALENDEVVGWQLDVVGSVVNFSISSTDEDTFLDIANVAITPTQILIQDTSSTVTVSSMQYGQIIPLVTDVEYLDANDLLTGGAAAYRDDDRIASRQIIGGHVHATIVPEPGTSLLLGLGGIGMGLVGRRRSKRAKTR